MKTQRVKTKEVLQNEINFSYPWVDSYEEGLELYIEDCKKMLADGKIEDLEISEDLITFTVI